MWTAGSNSPRRPLHNDKKLSNLCPAAPRAAWQGFLFDIAARSNTIALAIGGGGHGEPEPEDRPRKPTKKEVEALAPEPPKRLGRGGEEHIRLQDAIKKLGHDRGYLATIEKSIIDGEGSVDVSLEKSGTKIACEISVTTSPEHEWGNVRKCLIAGYDHVILVSSERAHLRQLQEFVVGELEKRYHEQVAFLDPSGVFAYLDKIDAAAEGGEETVRGYKVKVGFKPLEDADQKSRRQAIANVILRSAKRPKDTE